MQLLVPGLPRGWGCPAAQNLSNPVGSAPHSRKEMQSRERQCTLNHEDAPSSKVGAGQLEGGQPTASPTRESCRSAHLPGSEISLPYLGCRRKVEGCQTPPSAHGSEPLSLTLLGSHGGQ